MGSRLLSMEMEEIIWAVTGFGLNFGIYIGRAGLWWRLTTCGELRWNGMSILKCSYMNCVYGKRNEDHIVRWVGYKLDSRGGCISVPSSCKNVSLFWAVQIDVEVALSLLCRRYKGVFSPGLMWPGHEADYSSAEYKNVFTAVPPLPPCAFMEFTVTNLLFTAEEAQYTSFNTSRFGCLCV